LFQKLIIAIQNGNTRAIKEEIAQHIASYLQNWHKIGRIFVNCCFRSAKLMPTSK
jgi:DNA-binding FadR family transcriptional regulator